MKVMMPLSGKFFLLHWKQHNEGGHIILARSKPALMKAARRVFSKFDPLHPIKGKHSPGYDQVKVMQFLSIEVAGPSLRLSKQVEAEDRQRKVEEFVQEVCFALSEQIEIDSALPNPFVWCQDWSLEPEEQIRYAETGHHFSCENCFSGVRLDPRYGDELFYQEHNEEWYRQNPAQSHRATYVSPAAESRALPAGDDEKLWTIGANFGHHSSGLELEEYDPLSPGFEPKLYRDGLFFFRLLEELDLSEVLSIQEEILQRKLQVRLELEEISNKKKVKALVEKRHAVLSFFMMPEEKKDP